MPTTTADRVSVELDWRLDFFDNQFWMTPGNADAIPDKRKQRVGKPVQPTQILDLMAVFEMQVHPNVKKFVDAESGYVVGFETTGSQEFARDVVVPFERCDTPAHRSLSKRSSAFSMTDADVLLWHGCDLTDPAGRFTLDCEPSAEFGQIGGRLNRSMISERFRALYGSSF